MKYMIEYKIDKFDDEVFTSFIYCNNYNFKINNDEVFKKILETNFLCNEEEIKIIKISKVINLRFNDSGEVYD